MTPSTAPLAHLNPSIRGLKPSATIAINERSQRLRADRGPP